MLATFWSGSEEMFLHLEGESKHKSRVYGARMTNLWESLKWRDSTASGRGGTALFSLSFQSPSMLDLTCSPDEPDAMRMFEDFRGHFRAM